MGDSRPAHKVSTLFGYANDLYSRGILQVIHTIDCPITWSVNIYRIRLGSQVYNLFLEELPTSHGDTIDDEHRFSSPNGRSIKEDHPNVSEHDASIRPGS